MFWKITQDQYEDEFPCQPTAKTFLTSNIKPLKARPYTTSLAKQQAPLSLIQGPPGTGRVGWVKGLGLALEVYIGVCGGDGMPQGKDCSLVKGVVVTRLYRAATMLGFDTSQGRRRQPAISSVGSWRSRERTAEKGS